MKRIEQWDGQVDSTALSYGISTEAETTAIVQVNPSTIKIAVHDYDKPDKTDYIVAACSGVVTGLLDAFWVGEFSLSSAQDWGRTKANSFVVKVAQTRGYGKDDLEGAIRFLEKNAPMASDQLTSTWGGGLQHHFRDFAHHASIVGLIFSIMTQFTGMSYGTNTAGRFEIHDLPNKEHIGKTFEEKIFYGVVLWMLHLVSDMAGSSGSPGKGTGVPGPLLSFAKELSVLPGIRDIQVEYKGDDIGISVMLSKLFNGTAFPHTGYKDLTRFDLRTEMGIFAFSVKQKIPVVINQCIIRAFYFIRRLLTEVSDCGVKQFSDMKRLNPKHFLPWNNRCITRMSTIASGVFVAVNASDATIRALLSGADKKTLLSKILLRTNFSGIGSFLISIKNDIVAGLSKPSITEEYGILASTEENASLLGNIIIDISVDVDSTGIYEYAFYRMYQHVKKTKEDFSAAMAVDREIEKRILELEDYETALFDRIVKMSSHAQIVETEYLLMRLLSFNGIGYVPFDGSEKYSLYMPFYRIEGGKKIAYVFSQSITTAVNWKVIKNTYGMDGAKVVALVELGEDSETRGIIVNEKIRKAKGFVEYITLREFFTLIPGDEYSTYLKYAKKYLQDVNRLIGYRTIVVPSESSLRQLRITVEAELRSTDFDSLLRKEGLYDDQIQRIRHNFWDRDIYKALFGTMSFAESFISSEWYCQTHMASTVLEQTAIIAGYLKSVEQLLYSLTQLSSGTGKKIKKKGNGGIEYIEYCEDNAEYIDFSLGAMIGFVRHYSDLWDVNTYAKNYIANKLDIFREQYRNDHFHKDNIHSKEEILEIRSYVLMMIYLLLGGMRIEEAQKDKLGIQHLDCNLIEKKCLKYHDLEEWLDRILGGDVLLPVESNIYFWVGGWGTEQWRLVFSTVSKFTDQGFPEGLECPYIGDDLRWDCLGEDKDMAEQAVMEMLVRYLKEGRHSSNLKVYASVSVGWFGRHTTLHPIAREQ